MYPAVFYSSDYPEIRSQNLTSPPTIRKVRMSFHEGTAAPCVDLFLIPTYFAGTREDKKMPGTRLGEIPPVYPAFV